MELLIAVAILSIVVASVCGFILVGSNSYATANSDINVQQSAQLALNQMSDVLIDTTRSVNYGAFDAGGAFQMALKDSEFTFTPEDKNLIMFNGMVEQNVSPGGATTTEAKEGNGNKHYQFYWSKADETLYYTEQDVKPEDVDTKSITLLDFDPTNPKWVELAAHVTDFSVDLTQVEEKRVVMLALTFKDGKKEYVTSNNVTIRNKVGVNDAALETLDKRKTLAVKIMDKPIVEPGETFHFSVPKVTGLNVADRSVEWSVVTQSSRSGGTAFSDSVNGILKVAKDEPAGKVKVMVKTNARDSEGNQASDIVEVDIKRVTSVTLSKTADDDPTNGPKEVSPGCTFTVSVTSVGGNKLGETCSVCGEDTTIDKQVSYEGNPCGCGYVWRVYNPSTEGGTYDPTTYVEIIESAADHATFHIKDGADTTDGNVTHGFVIQAVSLLSLYDNTQGRHYDGVPGIETGWVPGAIDFTVEKSKNPVKPLTGDLQYGSPDDALHEDLKSDEDKGWLSSENPRYVTCIRVVDNTGKQEDKVLLHFTQGGGANIRIVPDMFDLDLNGSYTFYMQVLDVPNDNGVTDSKAEIWDEYINHLSPTSPYGYIGTKYDYRSVRYAKLDKPKVTLKYKGVDYTGEQVTLDPLNVYMYGPGNSIISRGTIWPTDFYQIEKNKAAENLTYSIYKEEGGTWKPIYYFDKDSMSYKGDNRLKDSNNATIAEFNVRGDPFMKMENGNKQELCGTYRFVPGITYDNKNISGGYEYIGWQGFPECPYSPGATFSLTHEKKYYEFDDSTIYVEFTDEFTMDIDHSDFKGQAMFPLPKEMKRSSLFPNINSLDWQTTVGKLTVKAQRDNSWNAEDLTFTYVRYRYIKTENAWEVEPIRLEYRAGLQKIQVHSYGIYKCGENEKKWVCITRGGTTEKEFTIKQFEFNGGSYRTDFPLPTDGSFPFAGGTGEIKRTVELYDSNMNQANNVPVFTVSCKKNGEAYEIEFRTEEGAPSWEPNNHQITVHHYGTYTWSPSSGQNGWTRTKGNYTDYKTNYVTNLEGAVVNGTSYKMYFPLPSESSFPFKGGATKINCSNVAYAVTDIYCKSADYTLQQQADIEYTHSGNTHRITFVNRWNGSQKYGTFECTDGGTGWTKVN